MTQILFNPSTLLDALDQHPEPGLVREMVRFLYQTLIGAEATLDSDGRNPSSGWAILAVETVAYRAHGAQQLVVLQALGECPRREARAMSLCRMVFAELARARAAIAGASSSRTASLRRSMAQPYPHPTHAIGAP